MSLDTDALREVLGGIITARIGADLSQVQGVPAIVSARDKNTKLKYPYATMDIIDIHDTNAAVTSIRKTDGGFPIYTTDTDVVFEVSVRADDFKSYDLARRLHKTFTMRSYLDDLLSKDISVASVSNITPVPDVLATRYQEFNTFTLTFRVKDTEIDTSEGYISRVETKGYIVNFSQEPHIVEFDTIGEYVNLWAEGVYQYSGTWVFSDTWGVE